MSNHHFGICCERCQFYWTCEQKWYRSEKGEETVCCESCNFFDRCSLTKGRRVVYVKKVVEIEGKTAKEAIEVALKKLHAKKDEVDIKILREEQKGLFGREWSERAKVKVVLRKREK